MWAGVLWLKTRAVLRGLTGAQWLFVLMLIVGAFNFPTRVRGFVEPAWPIVQLGLDPEAQYRLQLGDVPYDMLRQSAALLPRDASILLVTDGRDVRHFEYTTFHRALYFLTPRAVWWVSPAPSDGTWESNWWISTPFAEASIRRVADEKRVTHVLLLGAAQSFALGERSAEWPGASLVTLAGGIASSPLEVRQAEFAAPAWPLQIALALAVIVALGSSALAWIGYRAVWYESAALAWVLGAGITSLGMTYLGWLGVGLNAQIVALSVVALVGTVSTNRLSASRHRINNESTSQPIGGCEETTGSTGALRRVVTTKMLWPMLVLLLNVAFVVVLAIGRPLSIWDSWVTWGMKARTIFVEEGLSPALYLDASRAVTHLDYPLMIPQLEAWTYGWLGAADDRFAGWQSIGFYLALLGVFYSALRRWGASVSYAAWGTAAVASLGPLALWSGLVFAEVHIAVLASIVLLYLIEWLEAGSKQTMWIAALCAGLLPWAKREGWVLFLAMCLCVIVCGRERRAWKAVGAMLLAAALLAGPWYLFVSANAIANTDFLPINLSTFMSNLDRLPVIAGMMINNLLDGSWNLVWPLAVLFAIRLVWRRLQIRRVQQGTTEVATTKLSSVDILPVVAVVYLAGMGLSFVFSAFVPYQQHIASSSLRLMLHVAPLPLMWIAARDL